MDTALRRKLAIVRLADSLLTRANVEKPAVSTDLITTFNPEISIQPAKLGKVSSSLKVTDDHASADSRVLVLFNEQHSIPRQRFSIAHEYGHYLLHHTHSLNETRYPAPTSSKAIEDEADLFASSLLVPLWLLDQSCPEIDYSDKHRAELDKHSYKLASQYNVSRTCMNRALFQLYHVRKVY